jgi:hypothetical protein
LGLILALLVREEWRSKAKPLPRQKVPMKKPSLIVACILGALAIVVAIAVAIDMTQRNKPSTPAPQPVAQPPVQPRPFAQPPIAQIQNLQAPPPAAEAPAGDAQVAGLIRKLSDPNINLSIEAEKQLLLIGKPAVPALEQAALAHPDAQTRETCKRLAAQINSGVGVPPVAAAQDNGLGALQGMLGGQPQMGGADAAQMQALQQALGAMGGLGGALPNAGGRRHIQIGGGGLGQMLGALLAMQGGGIQLGGRGGHGFDVPNPQAAGVGDLSTNLLDSFGARLSEAADGVRVLDIKQGTPAANAGLKVGDLITQLNGRQVAKGEDVQRIYGELAAGDKIEIEVTRRGDPVTLTTKK